MTYWVLKIRCWTLVLIICETVPCKVLKSIWPNYASKRNRFVFGLQVIFHHREKKKEHYVLILYEACRKDLCMRGGSLVQQPAISVYHTLLLILSREKQCYNQ